MRATPWMLSCVLTLGGAAGCGGGDDVETVRDALEAIAETVCEKLGDCDMLEGISVGECKSGLLDTVCTGEGEATCDQDLPDSFDADQFDRCLDDIAAAACDAENTPASCEAFFPDEGEGDA